MIQPRFLVPAAAVAVLALGSSTPVAAEPVCYRANADTGEIRFHFRIEHADFTGRFGRFQLEYCMERGAPEQGSIDVTVDLTSVDTGNRDLTIGVQGQEALDVDHHPDATWTTQSITWDGEAYLITGELTLRGVTREETGRFELGEQAEGWRLTGSSDIRRLDYNVGIGELEDTEFIPNEVRIEFDFTLREP